MRPTGMAFATAAILAIAFPQTADASLCASRERLTGIWKSDDGGTYYLRRTGGNTIWWMGRSADGGKSWTNVFKGVRNGNTITGEWADVLATGGSASSGLGTLTLQVIATKLGNNKEGISGFKKVSSSGAPFGGTRWFFECKTN